MATDSSILAWEFPRTEDCLIREILEKVTGESCGLIGTNVNIIGGDVREASRTTPESLEVQTLLREMVDAGCRYAVMEVSSHALYLDRVYGIQFDAAVFTNPSLDHLDFHKTMDAYADAKSDRKSTRLNSSHTDSSRMPSSA